MLRTLQDCSQSVITQVSIQTLRPHHTITQPNAKILPGDGRSVRVTSRRGTRSRSRRRCREEVCRGAPRGCRGRSARGGKTWT
uniref:Uncharacterized protein n=1 Tax=Arundo donax TaxID=35708 RepID=A0A0A9G7P8_ARUDO